MSSGTCTHFQISYTAYVPLLIHCVSISAFVKQIKHIKNERIKRLANRDNY